MSRRVIRAVDADRKPMCGYEPSAKELRAHISERDDLVRLLTGIRVAGPWVRVAELGPPRWARRIVWDGSLIGRGEPPCNWPGSDLDEDEAARVGEIDGDPLDEWSVTVLGDPMADRADELGAKDAADEALVRAGWVLRG